MWKGSKGKILSYGAKSSLCSDENYILGEYDNIILSQIEFKCKNVFALECGIGQELAYAIEKMQIVKMLKFN